MSRHAQQVDALLELVRAGKAPPVFVFPVKTPAEKAEVEQLLRGRRGCGAFRVQIETA